MKDSLVIKITSTILFALYEQGNCGADRAQTHKYADESFCQLNSFGAVCIKEKSKEINPTTADS